MMEYFVVVIILIALLHQTSACSCVPGSIGYDQDFCRANFAIEGTISGKRGNATQQDDIVYKVDVTRVIRDISNDLQAGDTIDIATGSHTCGFPDLNQGADYLLAGGIQNSGYDLFRCDGVVINLSYVSNVEPRVLDTSCSASSLFLLDTNLVLVANAFVLALYWRN